jgi:hypothetical protein
MSLKTFSKSQLLAMKPEKRPTPAELKQRHPGYARQLASFLSIKRERFENRRRSILGEGRIVSALDCQRHEALLAALEKGTLERLNHIASKRAIFRKNCSKYTKGDYVLRYVSSPASWKRRAGADYWVLYDCKTLKQKDSIRRRVS